MKLRLVIDTNIFVSRLIRPHSTPGRAALRAVEEDQLLISQATFAELQAVLSRAKFAPYIRPGIVAPFLEEVLSLAAMIEPVLRIRACRDPKDDKFLEVAVNGQADAILTGDADLLALHPFRGIAILTPEQFLQRE